MTRIRQPWDRLLWGVLLHSQAEPLLLGAVWHEAEFGGYAGEPSRALLFCTRRQAREWCATWNAKETASGTSVRWRVSPVRVRETVRKV